MKQKLFLFALVGAMAVGSVVTFYSKDAYAACPPGTRYDCTTTFNGKQSCGCR